MSNPTVTSIPDDGETQGTNIRRKVQPGDFLILVQRRSDLFAEIIRACKAADLPIAGADRLKVGAELAVRGEVAVFELVASETLVAAGVDVVEDGHWESRETVHVHLVRGQSRGGAHSVVVREFDVWQVEIPVVLTFVDDHGEHLSHCVVDSFDAPTVGVVGARGDFAHTEALEDGDRELGAELKTVVGQDANWVAPERHVPCRPRCPRYPRR